MGKWGLSDGNNLQSMTLRLREDGSNLTLMADGLVWWMEGKADNLVIGVLVVNVF